MILTFQIYSQTVYSLPNCVNALGAESTPALQMSISANTKSGENSKIL